MFVLPHKYRYPLVLALVAAGVLAVGLALKPAPKPAARKSVPDITATRAELETLQHLVQRNSLRNIGAQFSGIADVVSDYLLPLADSRRNAIVWTASDELVAKPLGDLPRALPIVSDGQVREAAPEQWVPGLPFALAQSVSPNLMPPVIAAAPPEGSWIVAVSVRPGQGRIFHPGIYNGTAGVECGPFIGQRLVTTILLGPELAGGGVFDLQSRLIGVIAQCEDGLAVIAPDEVQRALRASAATPLLSQYGMIATAADADWKRALGADAAVVVTDVWRNWPADVAGLQPGDVVLSVDGKPVSAPAELVQSLTAPAGRHDIEVRRGRRRMHIAMAPIAANASSPAAAVDIVQPDQGIGIQRVAPGSSADRAGLRAGDRILEVGGAPATPARVLDAIGAFQVTAPVFVVALRGSHSVGVLLR